MKQDLIDELHEIRERALSYTQGTYAHLFTSKHLTFAGGPCHICYFNSIVIDVEDTIKDPLEVDAILQRRYGNTATLDAFITSLTHDLVKGIVAKRIDNGHVYFWLYTDINHEIDKWITSTTGTDLSSGLRKRLQSVKCCKTTSSDS